MDLLLILGFGGFEVLNFLVLGFGIFEFLRLWVLGFEFLEFWGFGGFAWEFSKLCPNSDSFPIILTHTPSNQILGFTMQIQKSSPPRREGRSPRPDLADHCPVAAAVHQHGRELPAFPEHLGF